MTISQSGVLILGGTGFIGSHLVERLKDDYAIRVFSRRASRAQFSMQGVDYRQGDWADVEAMRRALVDIDLVIHSISTTIPKTSNSTMEADIATNLIYTVRLLTLCVEAGVNRVVFISSGGSIYGMPNTFPIRENDTTEPHTSHGIVKLAIEKYLAVFRKLYGLNYVILRGSNVYGPRQDPNGNQGVINVMLGRVAQGKSVNIFGDGQLVKDYLYIDDFIEACLKSIVLGSTESPIYNIGSGVGKSVKDIISEIERIVKKPINVVYQPALVSDVGFVLDISRAKAELNWKPIWSLHDGISETWLSLKSTYDQI